MNHKKFTVLWNTNTNEKRTFTCQIPNEIKQEVMNTDHLLLLREVTNLELSTELN